MYQLVDSRPATRLAGHLLGPWAREMSRAKIPELRDLRFAKEMQESRTLSSDHPVLQAETLRQGRSGKDKVKLKSLLPLMGQVRVSLHCLTKQEFVIQLHPSLVILQTHCVTSWPQVLSTDSACLLLPASPLAVITMHSGNVNTQVKTHPLEKLGLIQDTQVLLNLWAPISTIVVRT